MNTNSSDGIPNALNRRESRFTWEVPQIVQPETLCQRLDLKKESYNDNNKEDDDTTKVVDDESDSIKDNKIEDDPKDEADDP